MSAYFKRRRKRNIPPFFYNPKQTDIKNISKFFFKLLFFNQSLQENHTTSLSVPAIHLFQFLHAFPDDPHHRSFLKGIALDHSLF